MSTCKRKLYPGSANNNDIKRRPENSERTLLLGHGINSTDVNHPRNNNACPICDDDCNQCKRPCTVDIFPWCKRCDVQKLKNRFSEWTSGNECIDDIIRKSQLEATDYRDYWEWIDPSQFVDI